jgi:adenylate cyclase
MSTIREWQLKCFTILLGILVSLAFLFTAGTSVDDFFYDFFFHLRGERSAPENIVVVAIDESSFDEINLQWPWPRSFHARLTDSLFRAGVRTLAFDILFAEPSPDDEEFGARIAEHQDIVLVNDISVFTDPHYGYEQVKLVEPVNLMKYSGGEATLGFANMRTESDGFIRRLNVSYEDQEPFSLAAARMYAERMNLSLDTISGEELENGRWINFLGHPRSIRTISYYQALDPETYLPEGYLEDALVFVGFATASESTSGIGVIDHYPAPFSRWGGGYYPGVEIHAHAASGFLGSGSINRVSSLHVLYAGMLLAIIAGSGLVYSRLLVGTFVLLIMLGASFYYTSYVFFENKIFYSPLYLLAPVICIYLVNPFLQYLISLKQKKFISSAFSTYLAPQVVKQILAHPEKLTLGGEEVEASIFFLDIAGFTSMSEKLSPQELLSVVNATLGEFSDIIRAHEGMIDKFIGDCIMAAWGMPLPQSDHANKAVDAALNILEVLPDIQNREYQNTGVTISFRIGISSGTVIAGNVGGGQRFNYTALGNDVNLAARLESLNKIYGTYILISESTKNLLTDTDLLLRKLDKVRVAGQNTPVVIYEVCARKSSASEIILSKTGLYQDALEIYFSGDFKLAEEKFKKVLEENPQDKASQLFVNRCTRFASNPPAEDWDGVFSYTDK